MNEIVKKIIDKLNINQDVESVVDVVNNPIDDYDLVESQMSSFLSTNLEEGIDATKAFYISLENRGFIDLEYISNLAALTKEDTINELKDYMYHLPGYDLYHGYVQQSLYLSGNVYQKYKDVCYLGANYHKNKADLYDKLDSLDSLDNIHIALGSSIIDADIIDKFIAFLFNEFQGSKVSNTVYSKILKKYIVDSNYLLERSIIATKTYGTDRMNMFDIIRKTLNHESLLIYDKYFVNGVKTKVLNKKETLLVLSKQSLIQSMFTTFLNQNTDIKDYLYEKYVTIYAAYVVPTFNGDYLELKGINPKISLYSYQKDAVARIIESKNSLIAHDVGTGKTFIMIAAGTTIKKMNPNNKIMYVVPNSILGQWKDNFKLLYPNSKIKVIYPYAFTPADRQAVLKDLIDTNYDAILIAYSSFDLIPLSPDYKIKRLEREREEIIEAISSLEKKDILSNIKNDELTELQDYLAQIERKISKAEFERESKEQIYFDDLKINTLFLDEAHNFKNLPLDTNLKMLRGINPVGSNKCAKMYLKIKRIQEERNSKIIFATGTPIVNSITDLFVMQKYLDEERLNELNIDSFDTWIGFFGELTSDFEIDVDVNQYRQVTRFSKFHNLKVLSLLIGQFTDFYSAKEDNIPSVINKTMEIERSDYQSALIDEISVRVDDIRSNRVTKQEDNLLKITSDGRKLALDIRLLNETYPQENNKVSMCADVIYEIYQTDKSKTQLVFSDLGVPKSSFNVYDELKLLLLKKGLEAYEVQFVHDATSEAKKEKLFEDVRNGKVKVIIGSTPKLGIGVNIQDHLVALHHLDVPWRPSDMVQREGRILRQGNENENVFIFRYVTKGTFDAYLWQILETKQIFISQLLSGCISVNTAAELDETVLTYGEIKALAIGNPLIKERFEKANELNKYKILKKQDEHQKEHLLQYKLILPEKINNLHQRIENQKLDTLAFYQETPLDEETREQLAKDILDKYFNVLTLEEELLLGHYQGFKIYMPLSATIKKPQVVVKGLNRYVIDFKKKGVEVLDNIDAFFKVSEANIKILEDNLKRYEFDLSQIDEQIANIDAHDYDSIINIKEQELADIDAQLSE